MRKKMSTLCQGFDVEEDVEIKMGMELGERYCK